MSQQRPLYYYDRDLNGNPDAHELSLHVLAGHQRELPPWRFHAAHDARDVLFKLVVAGVPAAWMRVDSWWDDFHVLKAEPSQGSNSPFPAISARDIERVQRDMQIHAEETTGRAWLRYFARQLGDGVRHRMLWEGRWRLAITDTYEGRLARYTEGTLAQYVDDLRAPCYNLFNRDMPFPWPLRRIASEESARIKWWRKVARRDELPPVLCLHVLPLLSDVIVDGHDRMYAALLEGKTPDFIRLEHLRPDRSHGAMASEMQAQVTREYGYIEHVRVSPHTVNDLNARALYAYAGEHLYPHTRVWPIEGGRLRWLHEVRARGAQLPVEFAQLVREMRNEPPPVEELIYEREPGE